MFMIFYFWIPGQARNDSGVLNSTPEPHDDFNTRCYFEID